MLTEDQLWRRIRDLQGQTIYTIVRQSPNPISRVNDDRVEINARATTVSRGDLWLVYQELHRRGQVTRDDLYGARSIVGHPYAKKTGRVMMAILARAVPEEIQVIRPNRLQRLSGIRRRQEAR